MKFSFGVYVTVPSLLLVTTPFAGCVTAVTESESPSISESLRSTSVVTSVSSAVESTSSTATGASLSSLTVIKTVAVLLSTVPSFALKVKISAPL